MAAARKFVPRPDKVRIGHMTFSIDWVSEQEWCERFAGYENEAGLTFHTWGLIALRLVPHVHDEHLREVLLHEITHAIWSTNQLTHNIKNFGEEEMEEAIIGFQSPTLIGVLKDNPDLVAYLVDDRDHKEE